MKLNITVAFNSPLKLYCYTVIIMPYDIKEWPVALWSLPYPRTLSLLALLTVSLHENRSATALQDSTCRSSEDRIQCRWAITTLYLSCNCRLNCLFKEKEGNQLNFKLTVNALIKIALEKKGKQYSIPREQFVIAPFLWLTSDLCQNTIYNLSR